MSSITGSIAGNATITGAGTTNIGTVTGTFVFIPSGGGGIPSDPTGVQAARIASLLDGYGYNLYPNIDGNTPFGASANYTRPNMEAVMHWLLGSSGHQPNFRCWYYGNRLADYQTWDVGAFITAIGGGNATIALGSAASAVDVNMQPLVTQSVSGTGWLTRIENVNEPNSPNYGQTPQATLTAADAIKQLTASTSTSPHPVQPVAAPCGIFVGGPTSVDYCQFYDGQPTPGPNTQHAAAAANLISLHDYEPFNPDFLWGGSNKPWLQELHDGAIAAYGQHGLYESEYHPTLYSQTGHNLDPAYDCYYHALHGLQCTRMGLSMWQWWSTFDDYGMNAGMFATGVADAKPVAYVQRAMYQLMPDAGATRKTFSPGKLDVGIVGLPSPHSSQEPNSGGHFALYQASTGTFYLLIWSSEQAVGVTPVPVTVTFNATNMLSVTDYSLSRDIASGPDPMTPLSTSSNVHTHVLDLGSEVRLLVIQHP